MLGKPVLERTVVLGEKSVQSMLLKVNVLPERMQLAVESGAKRILIPSENKRDVADVPDAVLTAIQCNSMIHQHVPRSLPWGWGKNLWSCRLNRKVPVIDLAVRIRSRH